MLHDGGAPTLFLPSEGVGFGKTMVGVPYITRRNVFFSKLREVQSNERNPSPGYARPRNLQRDCAKKTRMKIRTIFW